MLFEPISWGYYYLGNNNHSLLGRRKFPPLFTQKTTTWSRWRFVLFCFVLLRFYIMALHELLSFEEMELVYSSYWMGLHTILQNIILWNESSTLLPLNATNLWELLLEQTHKEGWCLVNMQRGLGGGGRKGVGWGRGGFEFVVGPNLGSF
jgi:hypothetical protein